MRPHAPAFHVVAFGLLFFLTRPDAVHAQQFVTDDASIVDYGACQLEGWYGREAGWLLPACQFVPRLELTTGLGWIRNENDEGWEFEYVIQGKLLLMEVTPNAYGIGLVGGVGLDPLAQALGERFRSIFGYVPLSISLIDDRLILHSNAGMRYFPPDDAAPIH